MKRLGAKPVKERRQKPDIVELDDMFDETDRVIESGNVRIRFTNGVSVDVYVAHDTADVIYITAADNGWDSKKVPHQLVLCGGLESDFEISIRKVK